MWKELKGLAEVTKRYNLEPKDNGIVGIYKGMKFEPQRKVDIKTKRKELNVWHQDKQLLV